MTQCKNAQDKLGEFGAQAMREDAELREHVDSCEECTRFLKALEAVDKALGTLPRYSAPTSLIKSVRQTASLQKPKRGEGVAVGVQRIRWASGLGSAAAVLAAIGLASNVVQSPQSFTAPNDRSGSYVKFDASKQAYRSSNTPVVTDSPQVARAPEPVSSLLVQASKGLADLGFSKPKAEQELRSASDISVRRTTVAETKNFLFYELEADEDLPGGGRQANIGAASRPQSPAPGDNLSMQGGYVFGGLATLQETVAEDSNRQRPQTIVASREQQPQPQGAEISRSVSQSTKEKPAKLEANLGNFAKAYEAPLAEGGVGNAASSRAIVEPGKAEQFNEATLDASNEPGKKDAGKRSLVNAKARVSLDSKVIDESAQTLGQYRDDTAAANKSLESRDRAATKPRASNFLSERDGLAGVEFQRASGYWSNTYVPGAPVVRLLEAQLATWNRQAVATIVGSHPLEAAVEQNWQPFDAPSDSAIATYLQADKASINGRTRLKVQIGIKATEREGGHRPAMNVGIVLDMRQRFDNAGAVRVRALLDALNRARQPGDRFSLTVAGQSGGTLIEPSDFRHGPLNVTTSRLFSGEAFDGASRHSLGQALGAAIERVRGSDDPSATLGSSLILLVTGADLSGEQAELESMVHNAAVDGVTLSAIPLGLAVNLPALERLVLFGQGHRLALTNADEAVGLVDRELHASSRAVARALRIRLRLAPGVELIEVLGAHRLDDIDSERVRQAEASIDKRLSRNLGIQADRGDDEEGIQIVIPSFYAGDTHVVLLDVVAERSGPVADLTVRYKDLVYLRNGVNATHLSLPSGQRALGPLERNVIKNQLAHHFATQIELAAEQLARGELDNARQTLSQLKSMIASVRLDMPALRDDVELLNDENLLARYLQLIGSNAFSVLTHRRNTAASMRVAAHARVVPPLERPVVR